nr:retrovirus-related Pol polyprotein from transposon TNT 1-94 [Tanacetum cinerariifolium]
MVKRMACMNTMLNIENLDGNIIQKHGGSKQVGFKQLGPGVETGVHIVHDEKCVWFEVELQGAQGDREVKTQQQNELVDETNVTLFANVRCFLIQSGLSKVFWVEDTTRSTYLVNRSPSSAIGLKKPVDMLGSFGWLASIKQGILEQVVLYRNMGFNESEEYKKTFIGSGVGTGSMQVLHRFEFEVKPLGDHTFEVEPQENIDQGAGLQKVQTKYLIDYQLAHDREQHLACELFGYKENSNEAAFVVAAVEKIYANESLTFNNIVSCEATKGLLDKAKENVLGMEIVRDQSDNTLRVTQSRFYNEKLVFVDFDYAMGRSITRYEFMILGCAGSLKANLQHMEALSTTEAEYMALTEAVKEAIWLKGLLEELGVKLNRMTVNCDNQGAIHLSWNYVFHEMTKHINVHYHFIREVLEAKTVEVLKVGTEHNAADALTKVVPRHKLQHCLELLSVGIG